MFGLHAWVINPTLQILKSLLGFVIRGGQPRRQEIFGQTFLVVVMACLFSLLSQAKSLVVDFDHGFSWVQMLCATLLAYGLSLLQFIVLVPLIVYAARLTYLVTVLILQPLGLFYGLKWTVDAVLPEFLNFVGPIITHLTFSYLVLRNSTPVRAWRRLIEGSPIEVALRFMRKSKIISHCVLLRAWMAGRLTNTEISVVLADLNGLLFCKVDAMAQQFRDLMLQFGRLWATRANRPVPGQPEMHPAPPTFSTASFAAVESPMLVEISNTLRTMWGMDLHLERFSAQIAFGITLAGAAFMSLFASKLNPTVFTKWVEVNASFLKNFSVVKTTVTECASLFGNTVSTFLGMGSLVPADARQYAAYIKLGNLITETSALEEKVKDDVEQALADYGGFDAIMTRLDQYAAAAYDCSKAELRNTAMFNTFYSILANIRVAVSKYSTSSSLVCEPVCVWIQGPAGVGKSMLVQQLITQLETYHGEKLAVWSLTSSTNHFDGYYQQPIVLLDDMLATNDAAQQNQFLHIVGSTAFRTPQADLPDKGRKFSSKYVIVTSNYYGLDPTQPNHVQAAAFNRRRHIIVHVHEAVRGNNGIVNRMGTRFGTSWLTPAQGNARAITHIDLVPSVFTNRTMMQVCEKMYSMHNQSMRLYREQLAMMNPIPVQANVEEQGALTRNGSNYGTLAQLNYFTVDAPLELPDYGDASLPPNADHTNGFYGTDEASVILVSGLIARKIALHEYTMHIWERCEHDNTLVHFTPPNMFKCSHMCKEHMSFPPEFKIRTIKITDHDSEVAKMSIPKAFGEETPVDDFLILAHSPERQHVQQRLTEQVQTTAQLPHPRVRSLTPPPPLEQHIFVGPRQQYWIYWFVRFVLPTIVILFGSWTIWRVWKYCMKSETQMEAATCKPEKISANRVLAQDVYGLSHKKTTIVCEATKVISERARRRGPLPVTVSKSYHDSSAETTSLASGSYLEALQMVVTDLKSGKSIITVPHNHFAEFYEQFGAYTYLDKKTQVQLRVFDERSKRKIGPSKVKSLTTVKRDYAVSGDNIVSTPTGVALEADDLTITDLTINEQACPDTTSLAVADSIVGRSVVFFYAYADDGTAIKMNALMLRGRYGATVRHAFTGFTSYFISDGATSYAVLPLWTAEKRDVTIFEAEKSAPNFPDISKHLRSVKGMALLDNVLGLMTIRRQHGYIYTAGHFEAETEVTPRAASKVEAVPFKIRTAYSYAFSTALTTYGDCGSPYFVLNTGYANKLVGIHFAGTEQTAFCAPIYKEDLEAAMTHQEPENQGLQGDFKWQVAFDPQQKEIVERKFPGSEYVGTPVTVLGVPSTVSQPTETRLWCSPLAHPLFPTDCQPSVLSSKDSRLAAPVQVLEEGIKKWTAKREYTIDATRLANSVEWAKSLFIGVCKNETFRVLSAREAITGTTDIPMSSSVDLTTSGGYRFLSQGGGKHDYLCVGSDGALDFRAGPTKERLDGAMNDLCTAFHNQAIVPVCFKASLKDEPVKIKKIATGETRVFAASALDMLIVQRRYIGAAIWGLMRTRKRTPIKVGMNAQSVEFRELWHYMQRISDVGFCADYKNFDGSIPREFMLAVVEIYNALYKKYDKNWTEDHDKIRTGMYANISGPTLAFKNTVLRAPRGNPSGQVGTTVDNCIVNMLLYHYCYSGIAQQAGQEHLDFDTNVALAVYGDDNIVTISQEAQKFFTFKSMQAEIAKLGMVLTPANKGDTDCPLIHLAEMTFLKRSFVRDGDRIFGRLERSSIGKLISYTKGPRHHFHEEPGGVHYELPTLLSTIESLATEMSLYPKEEYDTLMGHCQAVVADLGGNVIVMPHAQKRTCTYNLSCV